MDGSILDPIQFPGNGTIVLVLIQVTVSKSHWVNGSDVKRIRGYVSDRWEGKTELDVVFLFATRK